MSKFSFESENTSIPKTESLDEASFYSYTSDDEQKKPKAVKLFKKLFKKKETQDRKDSFDSIEIATDVLKSNEAQRLNAMSDSEVVDRVISSFQSDPPVIQPWKLYRFADAVEQGLRPPKKYTRATRENMTEPHQIKLILDAEKAAVLFGDLYSPF